MLTVGEIRKLIKDMPDDALVLINDPHSEFTFEIASGNIFNVRLDHTTKFGENYYYGMDDENFNDFINDNIEVAEEIKKEYKKSLALNQI